ncbi:MAG: methyltransferase domain-containing protein [Pseudonocardiaceae bacterium]|nr:methyltransferase domain-containing protein [Pseudonocardiaceae bacterium]
MATTNSFDLGVSEARRHEREAAVPVEFELLGRRWELLPEVFAPFHSRSTETYSRWLPYPLDGSLLEMGCGAGVTAVFAALSGCQHVTATDISAAAVENVKLNAARHGMASRVRALRGNMFDALAPDDRFDVIFWNSSAIEAPADFVYGSDIEWSIFDRDYTSHRVYLRDGPKHLTERGRLFLGFNTNGNLERLEHLAAEAGLRVDEVDSVTTTYNDHTTAKFMLLELVGVTLG